ncbi:hypothetical protein L6452_18669 [Arctium lappa]|uniref:Uncharacterized protein n=1 Tax=Arctium lappa TaxID=4217 RepID=A0ACB9C721_ARCLA|nr:hypothetical protein L6452_18669 [Arctium lappa]
MLSTDVSSVGLHRTHPTYYLKEFSVITTRSMIRGGGSGHRKRDGGYGVVVRRWICRWIFSQSVVDGVLAMAPKAAVGKKPTAADKKEEQTQEIGGLTRSTYSRFVLPGEI